MKFTVGKTHVANLALQRTDGDLARVDNDASTRWKPYGTVKNAIGGNVARFRLAGRGVNVEKTADVVFIGLNDRNQDGFAIGRPRGHVTVAEQSLVGEDGFLESAIRFCEEQIPGRRVVEFAQESEMLAVRGKGDGAVDILDQ